jgi:hypothetical protein
MTSFILAVALVGQSPQTPSKQLPSPQSPPMAGGCYSQSYSQSQSSWSFQSQSSQSCGASGCQIATPVPQGGCYGGGAYASGMAYAEAHGGGCYGGGGSGGLFARFKGGHGSSGLLTRFGGATGRGRIKIVEKFRFRY